MYVQHFLNVFMLVQFFYYSFVVNLDTYIFFYKSLE